MRPRSFFQYVIGSFVQLAPGAPMHLARQASGAQYYRPAALRGTRVPPRQ
jgi:hypothetical protein